MRPVRVLQAVRPSTPTVVVRCPTSAPEKVLCAEEDVRRKQTGGRCSILRRRKMYEMLEQHPYRSVRLLIKFCEESIVPPSFFKRVSFASESR